MALIALGIAIAEIAEASAVAAEVAEAAELVAAGVEAGTLLAEVGLSGAEIAAATEIGAAAVESGEVVFGAEALGTLAAEVEVAIAEGGLTAAEISAATEAGASEVVFGSEALEGLAAEVEGSLAVDEAAGEEFISNLDWITNSPDPIAALEQMTELGGNIMDAVGTIGEGLTEAEIEASIEAVTEGMTDTQLSTFLEEMGVASEYHGGADLLGDQLIQDLETGVEEFANRGISEASESIASRIGNLSKEASEAIYKNFDKVYDELASGRFVRKTIQGKIVEQVTGKIDTGNEDANNILRGIGNVISGGAAFAEITEASAFVIDSLKHAGVPIPQFLHEEFGGSASGSVYSGFTGSAEDFIDTLNSITGGLKQIPGADLVDIPQIPNIFRDGAPDIFSESVLNPAPDEVSVLDQGPGSGMDELFDQFSPIPLPFNGRIEIVSHRGNKAPINEDIFIPTMTSISENVVIDTADPNRDPTQGRPVEGDVFSPTFTDSVVVDKSGPKKKVDDVIAYDDKGTEIPNHLHNISHYTDPNDMGIQLGTLVGLSANEFAKGSDKSNSGMLSAINVASQKYLPSRYMAKTLYSFLTGSADFNEPDDGEFRRIAATYNGRNLAPDRMFRNGLNQISCRDEIGVVTSYTGGIGNVPAFDEFCGPFSPNAKFPTTLLGVFCFFHDSDYDSEGYFSTTADYKFMSRISQNLGRMGYQERIIAQITLDYFSNVGVVLGALKTKYLPDNIDEVPVDTGLGGVPDIFSVLVPEQVNNQLRAQGLQKRTQVRDKARSSFYAGLRDGIEEVERRNVQDVRGGGKSPGLGNQALLDSFLALTVVSA